MSPSNNFYDDRVVTTPGAYQEKFASPPNTQQNEDAFIAKFNNAGQLIWATLYGGNKFEYGATIAIDNKNNIYIAGQTYSDTGIASAGAQQVTFNGTVSGFVVKFSDAGKRIWGTYYGGNHGTIQTALLWI